MKKIIKHAGRIAIELIKIAIFWYAVLPWASDLMMYDLELSDGLINVIGIVVVTIYSAVRVDKIACMVWQLKSYIKNNWKKI